MENKNYQEIKSFSDACISVGITEELFNQHHSYLSKYLLNVSKLEIINKAINGSWIPDCDNTNQYKYYYWFNMSGFGFSGSRYDYDDSVSVVGSRLCYETKEQALYVGKQFIDIYKATYTIDKDEPSLKELYSEENILEIKDSVVKNFDYKTIKTYGDACKKLGISLSEPKVIGVLPELRKATIAQYKLMVVFKAINNGWIPNWGDSSQYKYYHYKYFLSSGFGFSASDFDCSGSGSSVGSRLCTYSSEVSNYISEQFNELYLDWFCINSNELGSSITVEDMEKIHSIACIKWKEKIISLTNEYKDKNPFINKVYLPEKIKKEMINACTAEQLPIVKAIFNK